MNKSKHQYNHSVVGKPEKLEPNSKFIKGKKKHSRRQTELINMNKSNEAYNYGDSATNDIFGGRTGNRRRMNVNFERTLDFIGIGNNQGASHLGFNNASAGLSGLFRTMNAIGPSNHNFASAAEAMGGEFNSGLGRSNSIFGRPRNQNQSFHARHSSVSVVKQAGQHFDTEIDAQFNALEESKQNRVGNTYDERSHKRGVSMYSTFDQTKNQTTRRKNNMSFNFGGNPFHFRRTISKVPSFMERKKLSRQLSIQK